MRSVAEHIDVPHEARDLAWVRDALQIAIALEHATLPLYLSAMYSLPVQSYTAYNLIRSVVMEEMAHMSTACNVLAAVGGRPAIAGLDHGLPSRGLPGGAEPDLEARLAKLSPRQLEIFMRVELPQFLLPPEYAGEAYPTIGALYAGIVRAIEANAGEVRAAIASGGGANQVGDGIGVATIDAGGSEDPLEQVRRALDQIVEQGEGSPAQTLHADPGSEGEESHYCRFAELRYGRRYQEPDSAVELTRETEARFFTGYRIPFPTVVNTLAVPRDGYAAIVERDPDGAAAEQCLHAFDEQYTAVLAQLDAAWNGPAGQSWSTLGNSVRAMSALRVPACFEIVTRRIPADVVADLPSIYPEEHAGLALYTDLDQPVFYGPRFRNLAAAQRS